MSPSSTYSLPSRTSLSFIFSLQPCHCLVHSLSAVRKNGGFGRGDHMSPSREEARIKSWNINTCKTWDFASESIEFCSQYFESSISLLHPNDVARYPNLASSASSYIILMANLGLVQQYAHPTLTTALLRRYVFLLRTKEK